MLVENRGEDMRVRKRQARFMILFTMTSAKENRNKVCEVPKIRNTRQEFEYTLKAQESIICPGEKVDDCLYNRKEND